jgi:phosphoribosylformylglycinamidine cyclo-ligase
MSQTPRKEGLTYRDAGVDIDAGDELVERIKSHVKRTLRPEVLTGLGGFAGLCALPKGYEEPILVACTDGVGTKLKLAFTSGIHDTVGIDLVAMNVNDLVVSGAEPLFFLDYFAAGKLEVGVAERVIAGIAEGCQQAGCALLGGETAELPGIYRGGELDFAGTCVGLVARKDLLDGSRCEPGDVVLGLASSGLHANGFSLVRRLVGDGEFDADLLLAPTRLYVHGVRALRERADVRALAHVTGGGIAGNLARALPPGLGAVVDPAAWQRPPVYRWLDGQGVEEAEQRRVFNLGVGMCAVVARKDADAGLAIGTIEPGAGVSWA